jgi:TonB-linked SusC/RagA family outer membrane protein
MTQYKYKVSGRFYRFVFSAMIAFLIPAFLLPGLIAQTRNQQPITVYGTVKDVKGIPVMGALVFLQESTLSAETDEGGNFEITVPGAGSILNIESEGFEPYTITVSTGLVEVVLQYSVEGQGIKDRVYMPWAVTDKRSVTGSITTITNDELRKSPVMSLSNAVSGRLPGFTVLQEAAQPGDESQNWRIRGVRTLEAGGMNNMEKAGIGTPIAIVDGFEREFTDFDPSEIESFSILRDAAATAIYGLRGANGVILITTKRGQANKRTIDLEISTGLVTPTRLPKYLDSYNYAMLLNEARVNDGLSTVYTDDVIEQYRLGTDLLTYPNNDYYDEFIKPYAMQNKASLTLSGGNKIVRYFTSFAYNRQQGLYDRNDEGSEFETPSLYQRANIRTNLDITLSNRLTAYVNMAARLQLTDRPYDSEATIFGMLSRYPPNAFPHSFTGIDPSLNKEIFMLGGTNIYTTTPLRSLSYRGFRKDTRRYFQLSGGLKYDLSFVTEGLTANFAMDVDGYNLYTVNKYLVSPVWFRQVAGDGTVSYTSYNTPTSLTSGTSSNTFDYNGVNLNLNYDRTFGDHAVKAFAMLRRFRTVYLQANQADRKLEDYALRVNYAFKNKYFLEMTTTLSGSDNFYLTEKPRMLFPAISGAWIVSDENFLVNSEFLSFLKLRASFGLVGNDEYDIRDPNGYKYRYAYRNRFWTTTSQVAFGVSATFSPYVAYEGVVPNTAITAEKGRMGNFGLDMKLLDNRIVISSDLWFERRYDIYVRGLGSIPQVFGAADEFLPITNEGMVDSRGLEASIGWNDKAGDLSYWVNAIFDMSRNKIINMSEPSREFPYLTETGGPVRQDWGLVALGLFKNQDDIDNSPLQTFGDYQPGDIKYDDLNNDDIIDVNDYKAIGKGTFPSVSYALDMGLRFKQFDFSMLWQGSTERSFYLNNNYVRPFDNFGSISEYALGRYTNEASWATADFPRLTTLSNTNNNRISTFWLKDATFVRLRNLEIGYNITSLRAEKLGLYGMRVYFNAYNLVTFDNLKVLDPEDPDAGISKYPVTKVTNLGLIFKF